MLASVLGDSIWEAVAIVADASPRSQIFPDGQYFHLRHRGVVQQSLSPHWGHRLRLKKDPKVSLLTTSCYPVTRSL